jgi:hypothetical protein
MEPETTTTEPTTEPQDDLTPEKWLESLDEKSKAFYEENTKGMKSALESERAEKKQLTKTLKELQAQAEKGSDAEKKLAAVIESQEATDKRAEFYEVAHSKGVTNLKLAWTAASGDESVQLRDGSVDFTKLQETYPELFRSKTASTSAVSGAGTEQHPAKSTNQAANDWIRQAAGKR